MYVNTILIQLNLEIYIYVYVFKQTPIDYGQNWRFWLVDTSGILENFMTTPVTPNLISTKRKKSLLHLCPTPSPKDMQTKPRQESMEEKKQTHQSSTHKQKLGT